MFRKCVGIASFSNVVFVVCPAWLRRSVARWPKFRPKSTKSGLTKKVCWKNLRPNFTKSEEKGQRKFLKDFSYFRVVY
jgi:hypothetical protein